MNRFAARPFPRTLGVWSIAGTLLILASAQTAEAGVNVWTSHDLPRCSPVGTNQSCLVAALAIDPRTPATLYAGTWGGVFKSTDAGSTWHAASIGLPDFHLGSGALVIDPSTTPTTLYLSWTDAGMFKSTDGGRSWSMPGAGLLGPSPQLAIDPFTPTTIYAGTCTGTLAISDNGVAWSTNGASTWSFSNAGLPGTCVRSVAIDPSTTPTTLYAGMEPGGVFKSTDAANTWSGFNTGLVPGGGVFKSTDGGNTWSAANMGLPAFTTVSVLAVDPSTTPATLYAGTSANSPVLYGVPSVNALAVDPHTPTTLYAGTFGQMRVGGFGVFKSTDGGNTWSDTGLVSGGVFALAIDPLTPTTVYAGTAEGVFDIEQVSVPETPAATPTPTQVGFCGGIEATCTPLGPPTPTAIPCDATGSTCTPTVTPTQTLTPVSCAGDCDGGGRVTVGEIITMVNIALGATNASVCPNNIAKTPVTIDQLLTAVNHALNGCAATPTSTAVPTQPRVRFIDNADGTFTDTQTGLMWEKKDHGEGLHDDRVAYAWAGNCSDQSGNCQPNAAAATTCTAATGGAAGCAQCGGSATCLLFPFETTIWDWLNQLNAAKFAGYSDWRIPTVARNGDMAELETIFVNIDCAHGDNEACVAFSEPCTVGCTVTYCSCTQGFDYWSATTGRSEPDYSGAFTLDFGNGHVSGGLMLEYAKTSEVYVRAVRDGS